MTAGAGVERILATAFGYRSAKVLLSAAEIGVFDALAGGPLDSVALARRLGLAGRGAADFFDALVAMEVLERDDIGRYANAQTAAACLVRGKPEYIGNHLAYLNATQYGTWDRLTDALLEGVAQGGPCGSGGFAAFYEDTARFERFINGMSASIVRPARALAARFPWTRYRSFTDIGTAEGRLAAEIATQHPHLTGTGFDLARVEPLFARMMHDRGIARRMSFVAGDFFDDPLPSADVLVFARVLHDWSPAERRRLLAKAYQAIHAGGAVIVCEMLIDDTRRANLSALLASLNMLLMTESGSESTPAELDRWMREAGFGETTVLPLALGYCAMIGLK